MRTVYIIGTIHNMLPTYTEELKLILENINPDQVLVEIVSQDLKSKNVRKYPKEMIYASRWGIKHNKIVNGFDSPIKIERKAVTKKELKEVEKDMFKVLGKYGWKELNKPNYDHIEELDILADKIIDDTKHKLRQKKMLENIRKMMIKNGKVLILTGSYHLNFFEKNLKGALFPLRK